jgi:hypothetical protein
MFQMQTKTELLAAVILTFHTTTLKMWQTVWKPGKNIFECYFLFENVLVTQLANNFSLLT